MPIPFPTPLPPDPALNTSAKSAWLVTTPPTAAFFFDQTSLRRRVGSAISVSGTAPNKTLNITAGGNALTFDLSGDGTARIPVGVIDP